jgi:hypothetical protein
MRRFQRVATVPPAGQTDKWKVLKARVKAENVPKWAQPSQESVWESGWEVRDGAGKRVMECEMCTENDKEGRGKALAVKVAEVQNMARHVLRKALVLWLSGQHLNRPCKSGEATKATGKQKWPTLRNVGIRYSLALHGVHLHVQPKPDRIVRKTYIFLIRPSSTSLVE